MPSSSLPPHAAVVALLALVLAPLSGVVASSCPQQCNGHGTCSTANLKCACYEKWQGGSCLDRTCPFGRAWADNPSDTDVAHAPAECSGRGKCARADGLCECQSGYEGLSCSRLACSKNCNGHGRCVSMQRHAETKPLASADDAQHAYVSNWDAQMLYGCECDGGYTGSDCTIRQCPTGDDPMTFTFEQGGDDYDEMQLFTCTAAGGYFALTFRGESTAPIAYDAQFSDIRNALNQLPGVMEVRVAFSNPEAAGVCQPTDADGGRNVVSVTFLKDFGDLPPLVWETSGGTGLLADCGADAATACSATADCCACGTQNLCGADASAGLKFAYDGETLGDQAALLTSVRGTKEEAECAGRGLCDATIGTCLCYPGYATSDGRGNAGTRGDCGFKEVSITACPGETACSGHGVCSNSPSFKCSCSNGWMGGDCALRECPKGKSWFSYPSAAEKAHELAECSNAGICDRTTGECMCDEAVFAGLACQSLFCPGGASAPCSGHGSCQSMRELALNAKENGESVARTYGTTRPNDNVHWDTDAAYACACEEGYEGYDCSLRSCPKGDDIDTPNEAGVPPQRHEVQILLCDASDGLVTFKFRDAWAPFPISFEATAEQLKDHLESISTVREISVVYKDGATMLCGDEPIQVTFLGNLGDVPPLRVHSTTFPESDPDHALFNANALRVASGGDRLPDAEDGWVSATGTLENVECGNRGICDYSTGLCSCFTGYGSSDGSGRSGLRGDCGYRLPVFLAAA